jgi:hypothetical protein
MAPRPSSPPAPTPLARRHPFAFCAARLMAAGWESFNSMKHRIIATDLRTDLVVITIVLGAVAVCVVIGFMFVLVIAPF